MMEQDPELLRAEYNLPRDAPISTHYIGETSQSDIANAFSSNKTPQPLKAVIQCVSEVQLKLKNKETMYTTCLLDTGSVLNFVSRALMDKIGRSPEGTWAGSIKTVSGIQTISTSFFNICLLDTKGGYHFVRALEIDSIGTSSYLDHDDFMDLCQTMKISPKLVQHPKGLEINLLLGLDALNLLGHAVTAIQDSNVGGQNRKLNYPSPHYDNIRLFSTPLNNRLFLAGTYRKPNANQYFTFNSKASFNGFSLPHNRFDDLNTDFQYLTRMELISSTFTPQNVVLNRKNPDPEEEGGVSPPPEMNTMYLPNSLIVLHPQGPPYPVQVPLHLVQE